MNIIYELFMSNIYLYICIIIALIILATILFIIVSNQKNRKKIKNDFIQAEQVDEKINEESNELEQILKKMQEEIEVKPEDVVKKFEEEQEEKAIISYKELVDNVKSGKLEIVDDEDNNINFVENLDIKVDEDLDSQTEEDSKVTPSMVRDAINSISSSCIKEEPKKFKNSEFISPIYGIMDNKLEYPTVKKSETIMDIMNTKDYDKLADEIKRQEEFLEALKAFKKNL